MNIFWFALLFFAPAGLANAAPVIANKMPPLNQWKTPMDFGRSYRGKRILGDNKTWRGFVVGVAVGALSAAAIFAAFSELGSQLNLNVSPAVLGILLGAGALLGDAVESFFKRQSGVPSGEPWFPFDQIDYIIGGLLLTSPVVSLSWGHRLAIFATYFALHLIVSFIGYLIGLKDKPI